MLHQSYALELKVSFSIPDPTHVLRIAAWQKLRSLLAARQPTGPNFEGI